MLFKVDVKSIIFRPKRVNTFYRELNVERTLYKEDR